MTTSRSRGRKYWGGFVDGKLSFEYSMHSENDSTLAIFRSRRSAAELYEDVRPVIVIVPTPKRGKKAKS